MSSIQYIIIMIENTNEVNVCYLLKYVTYISIGAVIFGLFSFTNSVIYCRDVSNFSFAMLFIYISGCIGVIILGILARVGKRRKDIIGYSIVFVSSTILVFVKIDFLVKTLNAAYGCGVGIISFTTASMLKDIVPTELKKYFMLLFGIGYGLGISTSNLMIFAIIRITQNPSPLGTWGYTLFIPAAILSLIKLILIFTVYKNDTPIQEAIAYCENICIIELRKIYKTKERSFAECNIIKQKLLDATVIVPSYRELFSKKYIYVILKASFAILVINDVELFLFNEFDEEYNSVTAVNILIIFVAISGVLLIFIPLLLTRLVSSKLIVLIGCIATTIMFIGTSAYEYISNNPKAIFYDIITILEYMTQQFLLVPYLFSYAIQQLTERGFTLVMASHWISSFAFDILYIYYWKANSRSAIRIVSNTLFDSICVVSIVFFWKVLPNNDKDVSHNENATNQYKTENSLIN